MTLSPLVPAVQANELGHRLDFSLRAAAEQRDYDPKARRDDRHEDMETYREASPSFDLPGCVCHRLNVYTAALFTDHD